MILCINVISHDFYYLFSSSPNSFQKTAKDKRRENKDFFS